MLASLASGKVGLGESGVRAEGLEPPRELEFVLDNKAQRYIKKAEENFDSLIGQHQLLVGFFFDRLYDDRYLTGYLRSCIMRVMGRI